MSRLLTFCALHFYWSSARGCVCTSWSGAVLPPICALWLRKLTSSRPYDSSTTALAKRGRVKATTTSEPGEELDPAEVRFLAPAADTLGATSGGGQCSSWHFIRSNP